MNRRWLWIILGVIGLGMVMIACALAGAGLTYLALQTQPVAAVRSIISGSSDPDTTAVGITVTYVEPGSPAEAAGIQRGDIILAADGRDIGATHDLLAILDFKEPGEEIELTLKQGDDTEVVVIQLEERNGHAFIGLTTERRLMLDPRPYQEGFGERLLVEPSMVITSVVPESPADEAGLVEGDRIIAIDGEQIGSGEDLAAAVQSREPGDEITLTIVRAGEEESIQVIITLGENPDLQNQAYLGIYFMPLPGLEDFPEGAQPFFQFRGEGLPEGMQPFFHFESPDFEGQEIPLPEIPDEIMPFMHDFPALPEGVEEAILVSSVTPDSPAEDVGIERGDLIISLDGEPVGDPGSFADRIQELEPGDEISLTILRSGEEQAIEIEAVLGENPDVEGQAYLGVTISGFMRFDGDPGSMQGPFHFEFDFPKGDEELDPVPGDEA